MDHQGLCVSDVGEVAGQLKGVDEFSCALFPTLYPEVEDAAITVVKIINAG